jgi:hypothetical protein
LGTASSAGNSSQRASPPRRVERDDLRSPSKTAANREAGDTSRRAGAPACTHRRPEGSSTARPSRPLPASNWLVAATVIPAEEFTREPRLWLSHIPPGSLWAGFSCARCRAGPWTRLESGSCRRQKSRYRVGFQSVAGNRNLKLFSQLNELYGSAITARSISKCSEASFRLLKVEGSWLHDQGRAAAERNRLGKQFCFRGLSWSYIDAGGR